MRKTIIITIRNLFIFALSVSVVIATQAILRNVKAEEGVPVDYDADELTDDYQEEINDIFNEKIKALVKLGNSDKKEDFEEMLKLVSPPELEKDESGQLVKRKECKGENLSTYCLAMVVTNKYFVFRGNMLIARAREKEKAASEFANQLKNMKEETGQAKEVFKKNPMLFSGAARSYGDAINDIDREIDISRQAIDQTLKTYNEMQMALIMHSKYKAIIKSLEAYRDKISEIRKEVDLYPITFLDLTTTACT